MTEATHSSRAVLVQRLEVLNRYLGSPLIAEAIAELQVRDAGFQRGATQALQSVWASGQPLGNVPKTVGVRISSSKIRRIADALGAHPSAVSDLNRGSAYQKSQQ